MVEKEGHLASKTTLTLNILTLVYQDNKNITCIQKI